MDLIELKDVIEQIFGKKISNRPDCEALSDAIYLKTKRKISYNTLRRLFDLAGTKNNSSVSTSTLDILANYCDHQSYSAFIHRRLSKSTLSNFYSLQLELYQNDNFTIEAIDKSLSQLTYEDQAYNFMNSAILLAFKRKDASFLKYLFQFKQIFNGEHYLNNNLYFLIQTIGLQVRNHPELQDELWKHWASDESARFYYFELFVDMDNLMNSHYKGISYYFSNSTQSQDLLFSSSLLAWRLLILNECNAAQEYILTIKSIDFQANIHPITVARSCNVLMLNEYLVNGEVSEQLLLYIMELKSFFGNNTFPFYEFWIAEGLAITQNFDLLFDFVETIKRKTENKDIFYLKGSIERIKIIEAYASKKLGKNHNNKNKEFNQNSLDIFSKEYDSLFYYALIEADNDENIMKKVTSSGYSNLFNLIK